MDFDNLVLAQPEPTDHQCLEDQFIVSGGSPVPAICGTNSGIHSEKRKIGFLRKFKKNSDATVF